MLVRQDRVARPLVHSLVSALASAICIAGGHVASTAHAQSLAEFMYQGRLEEAGQPANGSYDMLFQLRTDGGDTQVTMCASGVVVSSGVFQVLLDPGPSYPFTAQQAQNLWVSVRAASVTLPCNDTTGYVALSPTQRIAYTPLAARSTFALQSANALSLGGFTQSYFTNPANLVGTVPNDKLSPSVVRNDVGNTFMQPNTFAQRVGIGAPAISYPLEIVSSQGVALVASTQSTNGSVLVLENRTPSLAAGSYLGAINFGTATTTPGQIGYVRGATTSQDTLQIRAGNTQAIAVDGSGRLGIGTVVPASRLHVFGGSSGVTASPGTLLQIEGSSSSYFSMLTPNSSEAGVVFGRPFIGSVDAAIIYNNPSSQGGLQFRTGGNATRMTIDASGTVGVPGTIIAGGITTLGSLSVAGVTYNTPKVSFKALGTGSFRSAGGGCAEVGLSGERLTGSGFSSLGTTIELPHGATITNITLWCFDNDGAGDLGIDLFSTSFAGVFTSLRSVTTSGATLGYQAINLTPLTPFVVDNNASTLQLSIGMGNLNPWTNGLAILGARVTYTTSAAQ